MAGTTYFESIAHCKANMRLKLCVTASNKFWLRILVLTGILLLVHIWTDLEPKSARQLSTVLTKSCWPEQQWRSGAPPGVINPGPVFKPKAPIQGATYAS